MSFAASKWAWGLDLNDPIAKYVLLALAERANADLMCFPKVKLLIKQTGLSRNAIFKALKRLEEANLINREHRLRRDRSWTSNAYFLEISEGQHGVSIRDAPRLPERHQ